MHSLVAEIGELKTEKARSESEHLQIVDDLKQKQSSLHLDLNNVRTEMTAKDEQISSYQKTHQLLEQQITQLTEVKKEREDEVQRLQSKINELSSQNVQKQAEIEMLQSQTSSLLKSKSELEQDLTQAGQTLDEKTRLFEAESERQTQEFQKEMENRSAKIKELEAEVSLKEEEVSDLKMSLEIRNQEIEVVRKHIKEVEDRKSAEVLEQKTKAERLQKQLEEVGIVVQELERTKGEEERELQRTIEKLELRLDLLNTENSTLKISYEHMIDQVEQLSRLLPVDKVRQLISLSPATPASSGTPIAAGPVRGDRGGGSVGRGGSARVASASPASSSSSSSSSFSPYSAPRPARGRGGQTPQMG